MNFLNFLLLFSYLNFSLTLSKWHFSIVLFRHGARSPGKIHIEDLFPEGNKQLTLKGKDQMKNLGDYFEMKFLHNKNTLIDHNNLKNEIIFISSPVKRAIESSLNFLNGFLKFSDFKIKQINFDFSKEFSFEMIKEFNLNNNEFPMFVQYNKTDYLFHGFKEGICPNAFNLIKKTKKNNYFTNRLNELKKDLFPKICEIYENITKNTCVLEKMTFADLKAIYDFINSVKFHEIDYNIKISEELFEIIELERINIFNNLVQNEEIVKLVVSNMFELFLKFLQEKKENIKNNKNNDFAKIIFFSGHDTIMGYCIRALLTKNEITKLGKELSLNYASHFEIELNEENKQLYIDLYLNSKKLKLSNCENYEGKCDLELFEKLLYKWVHNNLEKKCKL